MHDLSVIVQVASYSIAVCPLIHICAAFIVKSAQATSFTVQHAIVCAAFVFLAVCDSPHTFGFKSVTIQIGAYFARVFAFHPFPSFPSAVYGSGSGSQYVTFVFQFSPLREGRQRLFRALDLGDSISILAPARGATKMLNTICIEGRLFQFSPLREGRPGNSGALPGIVDFNSRPCERGDTQIFISSHTRLIFQFSPLREGRRLAATVPLRQWFYFNSRPCERGDRSWRG